MASVSKLSRMKWEKDTRRIYCDDVREVLAAHRDVDRQISMLEAERAPLAAKLAKFEGTLARARAANDADMIEVGEEMVAELSAKIADIDAKIAVERTATLTAEEISAATMVAQKRTSGDTGWAAAARELLGRDSIDIADQRQVGCLSRAACR